MLPLEDSTTDWISSGHSKKKVFKGAPKKCDFIESINFNIASDPKIKNSFLNKFNQSALTLLSLGKLLALVRWSLCRNGI